MIVNGSELIPCPQGHFQGVRVPGALGIGYCGACGSRFDLSLPVRLDVLCQGHGEVGRPASASWRRCSSVAEHLAWEKSIIENAARMERLAAVSHREGVPA